MSRRRTNSNSVSLFPFLAVLLCAMGALLFLLIAATRMIRDEAVQKSSSSTIPIPETQPLQLLPDLEEVPPKALTQADIQLGAGERVREPDRPAAPPLVAPKPKFIIHEPNPLPDLSGRIVKLREEQKTFADSQQALEAELEKQRSLQAKRASLKADIELRQQILSKADTAIGGIKQTLGNNAEKLSALQSQRRQLEQSAQQLTEKLQALKSQPRSVSNPLKIVPYEGKSGTTRRPLILECRENSIVFLPEELELTEQDLLGFTTKVNPVLTGVQALDRYWTVHDGQQGVARRPYVLIVVRPDGIAAYYALRQLLSEYDQPFGYELLENDQTLALDEADTKASQVLSDSVQRVLARRSEFATSEKSAFALPEQPRRGNSNTPSERSAGSNEGQTLDAAARGDSRRPRFRMTPRGLEVIPPDELEDSIVPSPPRSGSASSSSNDKLAERSRSSHANPPVPLSSLGVSQSKEVPKPEDVSQPTRSEANQSESALGFPDPLDQEPIAGDPGSPAARKQLLPENPLLANSGTSGGSSSAGKGKGPAQPGLSDGKIRFQRELTVVLGLNELRVGYGNPIPLTEGISTRELLTLVVKQLRDETAAWGKPPDHLTWKPVVRFVLQPGGLQHYERIRPYFEQHHLVESVSFELAGESTERSPE